MTEQQVKIYLSRLKLGIESPSLDYLKRIHHAHLEHIPFENLDIQYGKKIILNIDQIAKKILSSNRGGYCFELNGLLHSLLTFLGFKCHFCSAQFCKSDGTLSNPMDHMIVIVTLDDGKYLADVGLMDGMHFPKRIELGSLTLDHTKYFRFQEDPDRNLILEVSHDASSFKKFYQSDLKPVNFIQFLDINNRHQEDSESFFRQQKVVTRINSLGERIKLSDKKLEIWNGGELEEYDVRNEDEFLSKLEQHFSISSEALLQ